jgi:hypothetical protein
MRLAITPPSECPSSEKRSQPSASAAANARAQERDQQVIRRGRQVRAGAVARHVDRHQVDVAQVRGQRHETGRVVEPAMQGEHAWRARAARTQPGQRAEGGFQCDMRASRSCGLRRRGGQGIARDRGEHARVRVAVVEAGDVAQLAAARMEVFLQHLRDFLQRLQAVDREARRDHVDAADAASAKR